MLSGCGDGGLGGLAVLGGKRMRRIWDHDWRESGREGEMGNVTELGRLGLGDFTVLWS